MLGRSGPRVIRALPACLAALALVLTVTGCHHAARPGVDFKYQVGYASWYGKDFHGKRTASGEKFNMRKLTAAHRTLPLGTKVKVENLKNGKKVKVVINDRGPFVEGRIIDLSRKAAKKLDMIEDGVVMVRIKVLD